MFFKPQINVREKDGHYEVYIDGKFFCSADTVEEAFEEANEYAEEENDSRLWAAVGIFVGVLLFVIGMIVVQIRAMEYDSYIDNADVMVTLNHSEKDVRMIKEGSIAEIPIEEEKTIIEPITAAAPMVIDLTELSGDPAIYISKTVWGEGRGLCDTEKAAIVWCILNRVDSELPYFPDDIIGVVTQNQQFHGYREDFPVDDDIYRLVLDVLWRWEMEKAGVEDVGRVLPKDYLYFYGDGKHNHYRKEYDSDETWGWSLENPYNEKLEDIVK